jgi:hypothetical protein
MAALLPTFHLLLPLFTFLLPCTRISLVLPIKPFTVDELKLAMTEHGEKAQGTEGSRRTKNLKIMSSKPTTRGCQHRLEEARSIVQAGTNSQVGLRDELAGRAGTEDS